METVGKVAKKHDELLGVGTDLVMGRIYDTNSFWIAEQLSKLGAWPRRIASLVDDDVLVEAYGDSIQRGIRVIITTGGLGTTPNDGNLATTVSFPPRS